jgi:hypothetical protein
VAHKEAGQGSHLCPVFDSGVSRQRKTGKEQA